MKVPVEIPSKIPSSKSLVLWERIIPRAIPKGPIKANIITIIIYNFLVVFALINDIPNESDAAHLCAATANNKNNISFLLSPIPIANPSNIPWNPNANNNINGVKRFRTFFSSFIFE